jgi:chromosome segregation ATPase
MSVRSNFENLGGKISNLIEDRKLLESEFERFRAHISSKVDGIEELQNMCSERTEVTTDEIRSLMNSLQFRLDSNFNTYKDSLRNLIEASHSSSEDRLKTLEKLVSNLQKQIDFVQSKESELNKTLNTTLDSVSYNILREINNVVDRYTSLEQSLDKYRRESTISILTIERGLSSQNSSIFKAIGSICRLLNIPNPVASN